MSTGSQGRARMSELIPEALRAVLTTTQQFLLMDTVLVVSVNDLRRALCDAEFAERLVQRPSPAPPVQQRAFTPRAATEAELAAVAQLQEAAAAAAARQSRMNERDRSLREAGELQRRNREELAAAAAERRRLAEVARQEAEAAERLRVVNLREQSQQRSNQQRQPAARQQRQPPGRRNTAASGTPGFDAAIRNITQSEGHRPGHVPVLGGQSGSRAESLAQARSQRVPIDWHSETMWKRSNQPRTTPAIRITAMPADELQHEVENAVTHVVRIFQLYGEDAWSPREDLSVLVQAKRWLASQTAFRALVQEAIRKNVSFSASTYLYITQFVLGASSNAQLADFVNHPVRVVTAESVVDTFGRGGRALRLDDD